MYVGTYHGWRDWEFGEVFTVAYSFGYNLFLKLLQLQHRNEKLILKKIGEGVKCVFFPQSNVFLPWICQNPQRIQEGESVEELLAKGHLERP